MNFVLSKSVILQDSTIAKLIYPALMSDVSGYFYERVQSLYFVVCVNIVRILLNPLKTRHYFPLNKVNAHAENVLNNWTKNDPNLTLWTDIDNPPLNGIDPSVDPANAEIGDWMQYLSGLYSRFSISPYFSQIVTFVKVRLALGICISPEVVRL